jgi:hypothetical protein
VHRLLEHIALPDHIWEPACGEGNIVNALREYDKKVIYTDIHNGIDFLEKLSMPPNGQCILTNPPYTLAYEFIEQGLKLTHEVGGILVLLLRNEYDCAKTRKHLFEYPFSKKIILTKRPRWIEGTTGSPRHNYAWYVWDWTHGTTQPPTIYYA